MMKRPRSFIATLLLLFLLCLPMAVVATVAPPAHAGATTSRVMNPRAGDPDQPDDGSTYVPPSGGSVYAPQDPDVAVAPIQTARFASPDRTALFGAWLSSFLDFLASGWR